MTPEITVVMVTYRQSRTLEDAIFSIVREIDYGRNGRLAVVPVADDSKTMSVLIDWQNRHGNPTWYDCHSVGGANLWAQRSHGLQLVSTPYLTFFDSDDVMLPGWLEKGMNVAEEISSRGKIPIVGPSYRMVDEKLRPLQDVILPEFSMDKMMESCIIPDFSITRTENLRVAFEAGCKVAREQFTPQYSMYCTWLEMLKRFDCEVRLLPDIGFLYRQHKGGMHNRFKRSKRASKKNVEMVHRIARNYFPTGGRDMKQDGTQA